MPAVSPLRLGAQIVFVSLGFAAVVGLIAVVDADGPTDAAGLGFLVGVAVFAAGGTIACALSCITRGTLEWPSLAALAVSGLALDLLVLAAWREIESEAYGKVTGIAFVWALFALLALGLTIAVGELGRLSRPLYLAAIVANVGAGAVATWLIATAGGVGSVFGSPLPVADDDGLLRALAAALVLLATLWFAALAASRLERATR